MADTKISALPAATTPLAGTEVLPVVQSGATKKVSVDNLTAGRSISVSGLTSTDGLVANTTNWFNTKIATGTVTQGFVLLGSATPYTTGGSANTRFQVHGNFTYNSRLSITYWAASVAGSATIYLGKSRNSTVGTQTSLNNGDTVGSLFYEGSDGSSLVTAAGVSAVVDTAPSAGSVPMALVFNTGTNTEKLRISSGGNTTFSVGNLVQGTAAKGVNFTANTPAAGMTSQLLNWYEEGTWTATLSDGTNNATMSATTCRYVRIGRHITVSGYVSITSRGSMSGALRITGLPFTCANANSAYAGGPVTYASGLNIVAGQSVTVLPEINTTYLALYVWAGTGGTTPMQNTQWTDSGAVMFSATYSV